MYSNTLGYFSHKWLKKGKASASYCTDWNNPIMQATQTRIKKITNIYSKLPSSHESVSVCKNSAEACSQHFLDVFMKSLIKVAQISRLCWGRIWLPKHWPDMTHNAWCDIKSEYLCITHITYNNYIFLQVVIKHESFQVKMFYQQVMVGSHLIMTFVCISHYPTPAPLPLVLPPPHSRRTVQWGVRDLHTAPRGLSFFLSEGSELPITAAARWESSLFPIGQLKVMYAFKQYIIVHAIRTRVWSWQTLSTQSVGRYSECSECVTF
jgi:hypothetical protein